MWRQFANLLIRMAEGIGQDGEGKIRLIVGQSVHQHGEDEFIHHLRRNLVHKCDPAKWASGWADRE